MKYHVVIQSACEQLSLFIRWSLSASLILPGILIVAGCGGGFPLNASIDNPVADRNEASFYELGQINFTLLKNNGNDTLNATSSRARIFYSYHPAVGGAAGKPLFVFLNGGPGCATTTNLFSMNTAPYTLDMTRTNGNLYIENPNAWTKLGNLLYIDAPNTGFSYNLMSGAWNPFWRVGEFGVGNYNPFIDADQVVRVLLRFLSEHPSIQANNVILVGESYGGTRVSTMLNLLLFHKEFGNGSRPFKDAALAAEIEKHFKQIFPDDTNPEVAPQVVARQFGRQILIQPQLSGPYQEDLANDMYEAKDSIIDQIVKPPFERRRVTISRTIYIQDVLKKANIDKYNYSKTADWSDKLEAFAMKGLLNVNVLSTITGVNIRKIEAFKPKARYLQAYRYILRESASDFLGTVDGVSMPEEVVARLQAVNEANDRIEAALVENGAYTQDNSMTKVFGKLNYYDDYLCGTNQAIYAAFLFNKGTINGYQINQDYSIVYGQMFLQNLALVNTFITDAALDLVIYSPALPLSFGKYTQIVGKVDVNRGSADVHDGSFTIHYLDKSLGLTGVETPAARTVYWPHYKESGHSVSSAQPDVFLLDVTNWLTR